MDEINSHKYLVLDVEHLKYEEDSKIFGYAIEVLNLVNTVNWANKIYKDSHSMLKIETTILYKMIEAVLTQKVFTNSELKEYYKVMLDIELFYNKMLKFTEINIYPSYGAEFLMHGLTYEAQRNMSKTEEAELHEQYGNAYYNYIKKGEGLNMFLEEAKQIINKSKNENSKTKAEIHLN